MMDKIETNPMCPENIAGDLVINFLDDKGREDYFMSRLVGSSGVLARWWNLLSYFRVLKVTSPHYRNFKLPTPKKLQQTRH